MDRSEEDARLSAAGISQEEKDLRAKEKKKGGLSKEQREELLAYEMERKKIREERVSTLSKNLIDKLSLWTETDHRQDVTESFKGKMQLEVDNLKMESFGLEILHAIGATYAQKATTFLKSQKFFGVGGFFSKLKAKGDWAKDTWSTISTAIDAQVTMEEMARMEEKGGQDWTDEKKAEYEKRVTGKILAAAWRGSKYEIQDVLREVCDRVLNDKTVKLEKRVERAQAMVLIGEIFAKVCLVLPIPSHTICRTWSNDKSYHANPRHAGSKRPRRRRRLHGLRATHGRGRAEERPQTGQEGQGEGKGKREREEIAPPPSPLRRTRRAGQVVEPAPFLTNNIISSSNESFRAHGDRRLVTGLFAI